MKPTVFTSLVLAMSLCLPAGGEPLDIAPVDDVYPVTPRWQGARILHIGDSHVSYAFRRAMARNFKAAGARFRQKGWKGSSTKSWIVSGRARELIAKFNPTVVVITLGTNEMTYRKPERLLSWVRALVDRIGSRACYWLGPPPLLDDNNGYNAFMAEHVAPCRYFDSRCLAFEKRPDGRFHLSKEQGEAWAAVVWHWMNGD